MTTDSMPDSHLSQVQFSAWALGERSADVSQHVAHCAGCRAKIEEFDEVLGGFRDSVRQWSGHRMQPGKTQGKRPVAKPVYKRPVLRAAAALAFVMALVLILTPRRHQSVQDDAALLRQIDQEVSRTVPAAMDPLSSLVAGDGARAGNAVP